MEMHQVRYFLAVARLLNFTRAAEACNVSQPSLTRAIQKLEDELGGPLFHRERTLTHLTALGRSMQPHLEQILAAAEAARRVATELRSSQLAPLTVGVAAALSSAELNLVFAELADALPGLQLGLRFASSAELTQAMLEGEIDLAVIARPEMPPDRLDSWHLFRRRLCMVTRMAHRFANLAEVSLADLSEEVLIHCNDDGSHLLKREAERRGLVSDFRHSAASFDQARGLILAGLGSAVLPHPDELPPQLSAVPFDETMPTLDIVLAAMAGRRRSPAVEGFIRAARAREWLDQ